MALSYTQKEEFKMDKCVKALAASVLLQAAKDYCDTKTPQGKSKILRELKGDWCTFLTDGFSLIVAEKLEKNETEIAMRLGRN